MNQLSLQLLSIISKLLVPIVFCIFSYISFLVPWNLMGRSANTIAAICRSFSRYSIPYIGKNDPYLVLFISAVSGVGCGYHYTRLINTVFHDDYMFFTLLPIKDKVKFSKMFIIEVNKRKPMDRWTKSVAFLTFHYLTFGFTPLFT